MNCPICDEPMVVLELHQGGRVVCMRLNGLQVSADDHLRGQISSVLGRAPRGQGRVELIGPDKISDLTGSGHAS